MVAVLVADNQENGEVLLFGEFEGFGFAEYEKSGGQAVCGGGVVGDDADGGEAVRQRAAGFGVDDVGQPPALRVNVENAVVAGSGEGAVVERDDDLGVAALDDVGLFDADAPRFALGVAAFAVQFAADFDKVVLDAEFFKFACYFVHAEAFSDGGEVEIGFGLGFGERGLFAVLREDDFVRTGLGGGFVDFGLGRFAGDFFVRSEAPKVDERADGYVECALCEAVEA